MVVLALKKFRWVYLAIAVGIVGLLFASFGGPGSRSPRAAAPPEAAPGVPAPAVDDPIAAPGATRTAILAGGCFWGIQGVFQHVKGVSKAVSGYTGGSAETANYEAVGTDSTGHAESVRITYDPSQVSYGQLLRIFFSEHDPTQLNRQTPDRGTQYRSAIVPQDDSQKRIADAYIAQLTAAKVFNAPIATRIESPAGGPATFFPAEDYHQDYLNSNPDNPYIAAYDMPASSPSWYWLAAETATARRTQLNDRIHMSGSNDFRSPEPGLTDAERRQLAELDRSLTEDDPALADALIWGVPPSDRPNRAAVVVACVLAGILLMFALTVGGPGAAAFTALAVLATGRMSTMLRAQSEP
jgi:peptide-methionine (S)-S-oxide reductase